VETANCFAQVTEGHANEVLVAKLQLAEQAHAHRCSVEPEFGRDAVRSTSKCYHTINDPPAR